MEMLRKLGGQRNRAFRRVRGLRFILDAKQQLLSFVVDVNVHLLYEKQSVFLMSVASPSGLAGRWVQWRSPRGRCALSVLCTSGGSTEQPPGPE